VYLIFAYISPPFGTWVNFTVILFLTSYVGICAIGVTMVLTCGEIDLSFGALQGLSAMVFAFLTHAGLGSIVVAILITTLVNAALGAFNGTIVLRTHVPSFVATLGTMMIWMSFTLIVSNAWPIFVEQTEFERTIIGGYINGFPVMFIWMLVIGVIFWILLEKTRFGNWTTATGGRQWAAEAAGVNTSMVKLLNFVLLAVLAGIVGIMNASSLRASNPDSGETLLFNAIAGSVVGGTSLSGGSGTIVGAILGSMLIAIINDGLAVKGVPSFYFSGFVGAIIVVATIINHALERRRYKVTGG
jgi:simple sugar transport system permease protein